MRHRTDIPFVTAQTHVTQCKIAPVLGRLAMSIATILLIILILLFLGMLPTWPHSRNWGYRPGGLIGIVLLVLIILLLTGRVS